MRVDQNAKLTLPHDPLAQQGQHCYYIIQLIRIQEGHYISWAKQSKCACSARMRSDGFIPGLLPHVSTAHHLHVVDFQAKGAYPPQKGWHMVTEGQRAQEWTVKRQQKAFFGHQTIPVLLLLS